MSTPSETSLDLGIVIPFRNEGAMTARALRSLLRLPGVAEVIAVNNGSKTEELDPVEAAVHSLNELGFCASIRHDPSPFNFQRINNDAARTCSARVLLFMNNDARLVADSTGLVSSMYALAKEPDLGAIGAQLLLGDGKSLQHTGVQLDGAGFASHYLLGEPRERWTSLPTAVVSAVTAAFVMVEADKFWRVGGFDERFIVCGGDVDLCLRLNLAGYRTVVCRDGWAIHDESVTRDPSKIPFSDYVESYHSYIRGFDPNNGDPFSNTELPYGLPLWQAG